MVAGKRITVVSDYGHHPTQIKMTMAAARAKWPKKKIVCRFPAASGMAHAFVFLANSSIVFKKNPLDEVLITDIYQVAGRESAAIQKKVSSQKLARAVGGRAEYISSKEIFERLKKEIKGGEIVLVMGAGDIYELSKKLTKNFKK
jgi:UDP-N-acetylmuramate-alanine ligase